jgi:hypothetical protein
MVDKCARTARCSVIVSPLLRSDSSVRAGRWSISLGWRRKRCKIFHCLNLLAIILGRCFPFGVGSVTSSVSVILRTSTCMCLLTIARAFWLSDAIVSSHTGSSSHVVDRKAAWRVPTLSSRASIIPSEELEGQSLNFDILCNALATL